ncbi:AAA family ATPase [Paracoccus sp. 22332]|uniref:AAA family ATPase n=1 Tax=Paracoccus sp. 22332 TaxID=3453913 RepID=UPI003F85014E
MSRFPIMKATFPDPSLNPRQISSHLAKHLKWLRARHAGVDLSKEVKEERHWPIEGEESERIRLSLDDMKRVDRHAVRLHDGVLRRTGLSHLNREDRQNLSSLKNGVALARISSLDHADELAARLHGEMPWMAPATEHAWHAMRRSVREGWAGFRMPPVILDGPPGIGKTYWVRRLGALIGTAKVDVDATGENASFGAVGCQRGWSSARPGRVLECIMAKLTGNPIVMIDELEKAGSAKSGRNQSFSLAEALLPLLESSTAADWSCPYYRVRFDMSYVSWILLTNSLSPLPPPLLSRCTILRLREIGLPDLITFAQREGQGRGLSAASVWSVTEALSRAAPAAPSRPSLRTVLRMLDRAAELENRPIIT